MKKESKITKYLEWLVLVVLLIGTFRLMKELSFVSDLKPDTSGETAIMIIGIALIGFLVLGVHELGHLLTGLWNGFRFELFVVGPLGIKRAEDKVKVYFNKNLGYYGGVAATSPRDDHEDNAKKFARILLAGPIASILFAIICLLLAYWLGKPLGIVFYTGGIISIAVFFATTIPSRTGMFFTDRKRYQRLVKPGNDQKVELAMLNIMGKFSKENSYKNINPQDFQVLIKDELPFIQFFGLFNQVCYELETEGAIAEETSNQYEGVSQEMSKNMVVAFNAEIEKYKTRLGLTEASNPPKV